MSREVFYVVLWTHTRHGSLECHGVFENKEDAVTEAMKTIGRVGGDWTVVKREKKWMDELGTNIVKVERKRSHPEAHSYPDSEEFLEKGEEIIEEAKQEEENS
jgi:hypothetical protein